MSTIEEHFERLFSLIGGLASATAKNTEDISRLESSVQSLVSVATQHSQSLELFQQRFEIHQQQFEQHQQRFDEHQQRFDEVISEIRRQGDDIRGLQTENRRILDQLINREGNNS